MMVRLASPQVLDLGGEYRDQTLQFLREIRSHASRPGIGLVLNFGPLQKIYTPAAAMTLAEIERARRLAVAPNALVGMRANNGVMDQVLKQIGVYERLGIECDTETSDDSVRYWRMATGVVSDGRSGGSILENYEGRLTEVLTKGLYEGVVEAMTNTVQHAYYGPEGAALSRLIGRRWWLLSQEKDGVLTLAFCDLGIGIPKSLPISKSFEKGFVSAFWKKLGIGAGDGNAIKVAVAIGESRTRARGRGNGLSEIVKAAHLSENGIVYIVSNNGVFTSGDGKSYARNHQRGILGTLVYWRVAIASEAEKGE